MERPIFIAAIFALITAFTSIFLGQELTIFVLIAGLLILLALREYKKVSYLYLIILLIIPIVSIRSYFYKNQAKLISNLEVKEELNANVSGYVTCITKTENGISFRLMNARVEVDKDVYNADDYGSEKTASEKTASGKTVSEKFSILVYAEANTDLLEGDYIEASGKLKRLNTSRNEGNYNQEEYYKSLGIRASFTISDLKKIDKSKTGIYPELFRLKGNLIGVYDKIFTKDKAAIVKAMTLGVRTDLTEQQKLDFKDSGIAHLLSISALHVSLLGLTIYKLLKRKLDYLVAAIIAVFIMLSYLIITNNGISCRRAVIMLIAYCIADNLARSNDLITTISLSLIILIVDDPYVITNTGFLLSFLSMAAIAFIYPIVINDEKILMLFKREELNKKDMKQKIKRKLSEAFCLSLSIQIATLPVIILMNYEVALLSVLLNLIVIPLFSLLMVSAFLSGIIGLFNIFLSLLFAGSSNYILDFYSLLMKISTSFKGSIILTGAPRREFVIAYYLILLVIIILAKLLRDEILFKYVSFFQKTLFGAYIFLIIIGLNLHYKELSGLNIVSLDVGQGDCQLVSLEGKNFLIDGGSTDIKNVGEYRIYPSLKYRGIKSLEAITVSHFDSDHVNGLIELLEKADRLEIKKIVIPDVEKLEENENYLKMIKLAKERGIKLEYIKAGDVLYFQKNKGFKITCLHPIKNFNYEDANDYSTSFLINYGDFKALTIGDATALAEKAIMDNAMAFGVDISNINLLKVGHHGSKTSSSKEFIDFTKPSFSVISCGIKNRYHHPNEETLDKLNAINSKIYITSKIGEIMINTKNSGKLTIRGYLD